MFEKFHQSRMLADEDGTNNKGKPMFCPGRQIANACADYETEKAVRTEMFHQDVDFQMGIEKMNVAMQHWKWTNDWTSDPTTDLAELYKQVALNYSDTAKIGEIVKTIFENKLRNVAEFIVGQQS